MGTGERGREKQVPCERGVRVHPIPHCLEDGQCTLDKQQLFVRTRDSGGAS
jgi:hypothetical protein